MAKKNQNINMDYYERKNKEKAVKRHELTSEMAKVSDNDNTQFLDLSLYGMTLEKIDINDIKQISERCALYFNECMVRGLKPGIANMCVWLGIDRKEWYKWVNGQEKRATHFLVCRQINQVFDAQMESYMQNGKINPAAGIFMMRNNLGYSNDEKPISEGKPSVVQEITMADVLQLAEEN